MRSVPKGYCCHVAVIRASHQFLHGTTTIPMDKREPNSRTRVTKFLCMTTNPEEKRKIIGDVFVKVSHFMCITVVPIHMIWWMSEEPEHRVCRCRTFMVSAVHCVL
jgi:hypothetical protein